MYTTPADEIADALRDLASTAIQLPDIDLMEANEGESHLEEHLVAERDPKLIEAKRTAVLRMTGALACEVCGFDFLQRYGDRGSGFCEVHHLDPIGDRGENRTTRLEDLAVLCSNCHRIIHRGGLITPAALRALLVKNNA